MASNLGYNGGLTCSISVTNLARAIKWYGENLGFTLLYKVDEMAWAEMATEIKGVNIGLGQVEKITGTGNAKLTFGVKDIEATRRTLEKKGVKFQGPTQEIPGMVKLATFEDPDGNVNMFYQDLQKKG
ncbi:MAG: VOC family protein [Phycisphaerales bacterium]